MPDEEKDKVKFETMDEEDSQIFEESKDELLTKFHDKGFVDGNNQHDVNEKNELECDAANAADTSESRWTDILKEVPPIAPILFKKFPSMTLRYKLIINEFKTVIRDLPLLRDLLPTHIKLCKSTIERLQKEKKENLWHNYTNSIWLEQLENSLKLLFSKMVSVASELKFDSVILGIEERNKEQNEDNGETYPDSIYDENVKWQNQVFINRRAHCLKDFQPIAPILLDKFLNTAYKYKVLLEEAERVIDTLPDSKYFLPAIAKSCKRYFRLLQKEKKKGLWNDLANISMELRQLEDSLKFVFTKLISIATELKINLLHKQRLAIDERSFPKDKIKTRIDWSVLKTFP